jgi:hypothetical protein
MPHSYVSNLVHYIFSTKERFLFIDQELELRLWNILRRVPSDESLGYFHTIRFAD